VVLNYVWTCCLVVWVSLSLSLAGQINQLESWCMLRDTLSVVCVYDQSERSWLVQHISYPVKTCLSLSQWKFRHDVFIVWCVCHSYYKMYYVYLIHFLLFITNYFCMYCIVYTHTCKSFTEPAATEYSPRQVMWLVAARQSMYSQKLRISSVTFTCDLVDTVIVNRPRPTSHYNTPTMAILHC
jgi:hypothetical protein